MGTAVMWIVLAGLIGVFIYLRFRPVPGMRNLEAEAFQAALRNEPKGTLIDVREPAEYARGHLEGAVNVPLSQFAGRIAGIEKNQTVFLYCQSGVRSHQAGRMLSGQGFTNLVQLKGGMASWRGPVEKE